jgi:hypothetical protein
MDILSSVFGEEQPAPAPAPTTPPGTQAGDGHQQSHHEPSPPQSLFLPDPHDEEHNFALTLGSIRNQEGPVIYHRNVAEGLLPENYQSAPIDRGNIDRSMATILDVINPGDSIIMGGSRGGAPSSEPLSDPINKTIDVMMTPMRSSPMVNDGSVTIFGGAGGVVPNPDVQFSKHGVPLSNEGTGTIFHRQSDDAFEADPASGPGHIANADVIMTGVGAPMSSDPAQILSALGVDSPMGDSPRQMRSGFQPSDPITNRDVSMTPPSSAPVSNESASHGYAPMHDGPLPARQPGQQISNTEVSMGQGGAAISNDRGPATIFRSHPRPMSDRVASPAPAPLPYNVIGGAISNERSVSFVPYAAPPQSDYFPEAVETSEISGMPGSPVPEPGSPNLPSTLVTNRGGTLNFTGDVSLAPSGGSPILNPDTQITRGAMLNMNTDRTLVRSGDTTKPAGSSDVFFGGDGGGPVNVGGSDVVMAATGNPTKTPGSDDVSMTLNIGTKGNQEAFTGATGGEPLNSKDHTDYVPGAVGKPLKRNVT